jgi:outer membrane protein assembly factor BamB
MLRSPVARIVLPLLAVILTSAVASAYLAMRQPTVPGGRFAGQGQPLAPGPFGKSTVPADLPYREPRVVLREHSDYGLNLSVGADGGIYTLIGRMVSAYDGAGQLRWQFDTGHPDASAYGVAGDGTVYVNCNGGHVWALDGEGTLLWEQELLTKEQRAVKGGEHVPGVLVPGLSAPLVTPDGEARFVVGQAVVGFTRDGGRRFVCDMGDPTLAQRARELANPHWAKSNAPALMDNLTVGFQAGYDNTTYVATVEQDRPPDDGLRAVAPDGSLRWKKPLRGRCFVDRGHDLILDDHMDGLSAHDKHWNKLWEAPIDANLIEFDAAGNIYCHTQAGDVIALSPAGIELWRIRLSASELCAAGSGPLYALEQGGERVVAIDKGSGKLLWYSAPSDADRARLDNGYGFGLYFLAVGTEGTAYFSGTGSWLFAADP